MKAVGLSAALAASAGLAACNRSQSALAPHAPEPAKILHLFVVFLVVAAIVWLGVVLAMAAGSRGESRSRPAPLDLDLPRNEHRFGAVVLAGVVATGVTVLALSVLSYLAQDTGVGQLRRRRCRSESSAINGGGRSNTRRPTRPDLHHRQRNSRPRRPARARWSSRRATSSTASGLPSLNGKMDLINGSRTISASPPIDRASIAANARSSAACSTRIWASRWSRSCRPRSTAWREANANRRPEDGAATWCFSAGAALSATPCAACLAGGQGWSRPHPRGQPAVHRGRRIADHARFARRLDRRPANTSSQETTCRWSR